MTNCIISHLAPRDTKRRTKRNPGRKRAKRLKQKNKKRNGRKPRKSYQSTKYMDQVLSYINEDVAIQDELYESTHIINNATFDTVYQMANTRGIHMLQFVFTRDVLVGACEKEFVDVIKPNLTEEKFINLDLNRLHVWRKIINDKGLVHMMYTVNEQAHKVFINLQKLSKKNLLALNSILKTYYPKLDAWGATDLGRDLVLGEKVALTVEDARKFTDQVKAQNLDDKLYVLDEIFDDRVWNERMDHYFSETSDLDWYSSRCIDCKAKLWNSETMLFSQTDEEKNTSNCSSRRCLDCIVKRLKENREQKRPTFSCGKDCQCFLKLERVEVKKSYAYFSNQMDMKEEELKTTIAEDFESVVLSSYRSLVDKVSANPSNDALSATNDHLVEFSWGDHMNLLSEEIQAEFSELQTKVQNILQMHRLRNHMKNLDNIINQVVAATVAKNDEEMLANVDSMVHPIRSLIQERPSSNDDISELFGISMLDIANSKLQQAKDVAATAFSVAKRCAICTSVVSQRTENEDMITLHDDFEKDVATWHNRVNSPCHACKDCFGNFLNFKQSLGKPMLRCPGMDCGCFLDKKRVKAAMPDAFAEYKTAMLRFSLKRVENYRTCPNPDCATGIVLDSCCTSERLTCTVCDTSFCPKCNDEPHEGMTCEELQRKRHEERWGEAKDYMKIETKQCPHCLVWIEKNGGCNHMTCHHCRGEFCWLCFGDWPSHISCENKKEVIRRPFNELFPDWQQKEKTLKPRFHVGRYVTIEPHTEQHVGRVVSTLEHGMYCVRPVHTAEAKFTSSIDSNLIIEETLIRGYNGLIPVEDNAEELEKETYSSFLAGFDLVQTKEQQQENISVELTTKDASDSESGDTSLDEEMPFFSFMKGFDDSDDEDSDDEDLLARLHKFDSFRYYENSHQLLQAKLKLKTLRAQKKIRAKREKNREGCDFDSKSDNDEEESEVAPGWLLFINEQNFSSESDSEEESSTCTALDLFSDCESSSEDLGFESDDEEESS